MHHAECRLTSPQVRQAWLRWWSTRADSTAGPGRSDPPGCLMGHEGSFVTSSYQVTHIATGPHRAVPADRAEAKAPRPDTGYDFFRCPGPPVSADLTGMFHDPRNPGG